MNKRIRPAAVFFDWDGTLVDSYDFLEGAHRHTHLMLDLPPLAPGDFRPYFGQPKNAIYDELYGKKAELAKEIFRTYYLGNHLTGVRVLEGVEEVLGTLHGAGIPMGVVTNKQGDYVRAEIDHLGWTTFFKSVVAAGDAGEDKPSGAPLVLSVERAGVKAGCGDIWLAGDTENDILCAQRAGHKSVLIVPDPARKQLLKQHEVHLNFQNSSEFHDFLLQSL